jgi:DNA-binding transcriptional MerR regulator
MTLHRAREGLTVRRVSELTGLSEHTLRYYERIGLLDAVGRAANGHRRYTADDVAWIEFLTRLRATGMPIRMMRRYADLRRAGASTTEERRALLEMHRKEVGERLEDLGRNLAVIEEKIEMYKEMEQRDDTTSGTDTVRTRYEQARRGGRQDGRRGDRPSG